MTSEDLPRIGKQASCHLIRVLNDYRKIDIAKIPSGDFDFGVKALTISSGARHLFDLGALW
jgi:hypothetical protein